MAQVSLTKTFDVSAEQFYKVLLDYKAYPEFLDDVDDIEVIESSETGTLVKYTVTVIKEFKYVIKLTNEPNTRLSWVLESGDLFKKNDGEWILNDLGDGECEVTYSLDVDLKIKVPGIIAKKVVGSNMPKVIQAFYKRAQEM